MGFFSSVRQGRKDDAELGTGVWRRAHDRFQRGLDRFHQMLEGIDEGPSYDALVPLANELSDLLPRVRAVAAAAQSAAPSTGNDIPASEGGELNEVHRELSRSGNALATAAEAVAMVRLGVGDVAAVERRAHAVAGHVERAAELMDAAGQGKASHS
ncbi:hypothetical protein [Arthrobacter sp. 35W]|uniref:hypothetical protein n=1 Tax=Arthrobacter sp. 35W TaxID=1132441 RepID=UPI0004291DDF|nr:hypothetical protein [Arthrobacter sp. 35W]